MTAEARTDVHDVTPRCLLRLFDAEAEPWSIEVRGLSRKDLRAMIEGSTRKISAGEHFRLRQEASDFVRWGRRGGQRTPDLYGRPYFSLLAPSVSGAPYWNFKRAGSPRPVPNCRVTVSAYTIGEGGGW